MLKPINIFNSKISGYPTQAPAYPTQAPYRPGGNSAAQYTNPYPNQNAQNVNGNYAAPSSQGAQSSNGAKPYGWNVSQN